MPYIRPTVIEGADAAASTSTAYNLGIGQTAQGTIGAAGDHDWYRVNLVAGQTYTIAEIGTGTNGLSDTYLNLLNSAGTVIASNDDGGPGLSSSLTFTASTTGTYYIDAEAYGSGTGQYGLSISTGTHANFDIPMGAGAIDAHTSWSTRGTPATVTYGFRADPAGYTVPGHNTSTFSQLSTQEMGAIRQLLGLWSDISGIHFQEVNPGGYTDDATMLFANYNDPNDGAGAFAFYPGSTASSNQAGDVWLNLGGGVSTSSIPVGSYSFFAIMHEIGHALGLSHPGDYNAAPGVTITYDNSAQFVQDTEQYSVMSYFGGSSTGENPGGFATGYTPMILDIYALQQLYGANMTTRADDTVYGFGTNAGSIYAFPAPASNVIPRFAIWDAGGNDTINASGYSQNQFIDLREGSFSDVGGGTHNISIALNVTIENATGGSGNDTIIGNSANNSLDGRAGDDTAVLGYKLVDASIGWTGAGVTMDSAGQHDVLQNFEHYQFSDGTVNENDGQPLVDDLFYYTRNHDVWSAGVDADQHYSLYGWHDYRDPDQFFFTAGYLAANSDVARANVNPLNYYDQYGWHEGRDPSAGFDDELYLERNADVRASGMDPLAHYLQFGQAEGRQAYAAVGRAGDFTHATFDAEYYLLSNPDVARAALTAGGDSFAFAYQHYEQYGWHEGRNPNAVFDVNGYLNRYADVRAAGIDPMTHYDQFGWNEGRDPSANFDTHGYETHYADVAAAHVDPLLHYLQFGIHEGRNPYGDGVFA